MLNHVCHLDINSKVRLSFGCVYLSVPLPLFTITPKVMQKFVWFFFGCFFFFFGGGGVDVGKAWPNEEGITF